MVVVGRVFIEDAFTDTACRREKGGDKHKDALWDNSRNSIELQSTSP
jgi:hypothetical protein